MRPHWSRTAHEFLGLLEPLLVGRRLPPILIRRAGADAVHVGAEILAAGAGALAGTAFFQPEVGGGDAQRFFFQAIKQVSADEVWDALTPGITSRPSRKPANPWTFSKSTPALWHHRLA